MGLFSWIFSKKTSETQTQSPSQSSQKISSHSEQVFQTKSSTFVPPQWFIDHNHFEYTTIDPSTLLHYSPELSESHKSTLAPLVQSLVGAPPNAMRIAQKLDNPNLTQPELITLVNSDPVLVSAIMKDVNSAYYGVRTQVTQINRAIPLLGIHNVKMIALRLCRTDSPLAKLTSPENFKKIQLHADMTACIAFQLSHKISDIDSFEMRTLALIHNIGAILYYNPEIKKFLTDNYPDVSQLQHEAWLSSLFAEAWDLPRSFQELLTAIPYPQSTHLTEISLGIRAEVALIYLSKQLAHAYGFSDRPVEVVLPPDIHLLIDLGEHPHSWLDEKAIKSMDALLQLS